MPERSEASSDGLMAAELSAHEALLADVADRIVHISRFLTARTAANPDIVPVSSLEALVLRHVDRHPGISSSQVAADLRLRTSNASTVLRSLVDKGMLRRENDPADGRAAHFTLTTVARESIRHVRAEWSTMLGAALPAGSDVHGALALLSALEDGLD